ncbi:MAG: nucleotidyltransferase domain-containing protein [Gemmatirosa sp.]
MTGRLAPAASATGAFPLVASLLGRCDVDGRTARDADWAAALELAGWHGLQPALQRALARRGLLDRVPAAVRQSLDVAYVVAALRTETRRRQLHEVLGTMQRIDVPVIALKGAFLAEHAYESDAARPMSDLDLLLAGTDVRRAREALTARGYVADAAPAPTRHGPALRRPGGLPVELHHTIEPCEPPFAMRLTDVWTRAVPTTVSGVRVLALSPEDLLLHLATHMAHSHVLGASLTSVHDILAWTTTFGATADWDALVRRARGARVHGFVYAALALARTTFGAEVPDAPLVALHASDVDDVIVAHALALLAAPPFVIVGARAVTNPRDGVAARARRIARALLVSPAREHLGPRLPARSNEGRAHAAQRDGYFARWSTLLRLLVAPTAGWATARQVVRVRALRRWAAASGR